MSQQKPKSPYNSYAKYSSMGLQMGVIIFAGVFGGYKLDELLNLKFPVFTVVLSLLSVFGSIFLVTKDLNEKPKE